MGVPGFFCIQDGAEYFPDAHSIPQHLYTTRSLDQDIIRCFHTFSRIQVLGLLWCVWKYFRAVLDAKEARHSHVVKRSVVRAERARGAR